MKTSEKLISITCNPDGVVCIDGSDGDRKIMQEAIKEVQELEETIINLARKNTGTEKSHALSVESIRDLEKELEKYKRALGKATENSCDVRRCSRCPVQEKCPKPPWPENYDVIDKLWIPYYLDLAEQELGEK